MAFYHGKCLKQELDKWHRTEVKDMHLGAIPTYCHLYLGGQRVVRHIQGGCGLAALAYLRDPKDVAYSDGETTLLAQFTNKQHLGEWLLDLRARVEYCATMMKVSPSKLGLIEREADMPAAVRSTLLKGDLDIRIRVKSSDGEMTMSALMSGILGHPIG